MPDILAKPDWIEAIRTVTIPLLPQAYEEATMVLQALGVYEVTDALGGPSLARVLRHLKELREAIGLAAFPDELEGIGWQLYLF